MQIASHQLQLLSIYIIFSLSAIVIFYHLWTVTDLRALTLKHDHLSNPDPDPEAASNAIPKKLWYKLGPSGLSNETREWTDSCITANPDYHAEFLTDESADTYVQKAFSSRPDIVQSYLNLTVPILKADLLRYLLLYDQGGIWSDLDVSCEPDIPISSWIPSEYKDKAGLVVGWEFDVGWKWTFLRQFASWIILAKPRLPHMMQVINDIVAEIRKITEEHNVEISEITLNMTGDVVDFSGPRRLTSGVFKSLGRNWNLTVNMEDISEILEPRLVGDVLVMPGRSFAASVNTYEEDEEILPPKLVVHHYAGTWKNDQGGESGMGVEKESSTKSST